MINKEAVFDAWCILKKIWILGELEFMIDHCAMYSKKHWLILLEEKLTRMEQEL